MISGYILYIFIKYLPAHFQITWPLKREIFIFFHIIMVHFLFTFFLTTFWSSPPLQMYVSFGEITTWKSYMMSKYCWLYGILSSKTNSGGINLVHITSFYRIHTTCVTCHMPHTRLPKWHIPHSNAEYPFKKWRQMLNQITFTELLKQSWIFLDLPLPLAVTNVESLLNHLASLIPWSPSSTNLHEGHKI